MYVSVCVCVFCTQTHTHNQAQVPQHTRAESLYKAGYADALIHGRPADRGEESECVSVSVCVCVCVCVFFLKYCRSLAYAEEKATTGETLG